MSRACGRNGREEECVETIRRKESTRRTET
jgi:hypothetical protein